MLRSSRQVLLLIVAYLTLAVAWGWRLHADDPAGGQEEARLQSIRADVAARFARVPGPLQQAALFQLGMLSANELQALQEWARYQPEQRLRQLTVRQGPVRTPCPLNAALVLAEITGTDAPAVDESRVVISASGDRLEEPDKLTALEVLASQAMAAREFDLALEIHQRISESPVISWQNVLKLVEVARVAHRPAAALRVLTVWLDPAAARLSAPLREDALDLQTALLLEGGRHAEASRITLDDLRALKPQEALPPRLLQRALLATHAAGQAAELLPWIERHLRAFAEHKLSVEEIAGGKQATPEYLRWLRESALIADRQNHTSIACDGFFRLAAAGEIRVLARLYPLATQIGRGQDLAQLVSALQRSFSVLELAQALADGNAPAPARDLLTTHLKNLPQERLGWRLLTQIDAALRGPAAAPALWEVFLKRFPGDVPALKQLAQLQLQAAQHSQALRTLQQIPGEHLDEATLRQIAILALSLDDLATARRAQQLLVHGLSSPGIQDVMLLASLTRQHADEVSQTALVQAIAKLPAQSAFQKSLAGPLITGEVTPFGAAAKAR